MKQAIQFALRIYKRWVSPMLPHSCRFVPTCSEYAMEAIERHGAWRGSLLAMGRLLRCQPFARAGYDPVPSGKPSAPQVRVPVLDANLCPVAKLRLAQKMGEPFDRLRAGSGAPTDFPVASEMELDLA